MYSENQTIGSVLCAARKAAGYSIDDVSTQTRIRGGLIRDIEANNFETSGANAYARGHIRTIGKFLNLDTDALVELFAVSTGDFDRPMIDLLTENSVVAPKRELPKVSYKAMASATVAIVALLIAVPTVGGIISSDKPASPNPSVPAQAAPSTTSTDATVVAAKTSAVTVVATGTNGKSWIGIQDSSGAQVFSGTIRQGESKSFGDATQLQVTIGNAGAVSLNVNGREIGTPGAIGEVVHLSFDPSATSKG
jgi:cytoskeleton protein RodZ